MTDSYALLADPVSDSRRTPLLVTETGEFSVRATVLASDGDLLLVRAWLGNQTGYVYVVVNDRAFLPVQERGRTHEDVYSRVRGELDRMGYVLGCSDDDYSLLADRVHNGRRTSVLQDDIGVWSLRVKVIHEDEDTYLQLRISYEQLGFIHIVLHEDASLVAMATGGTDSDTWDRVRGELGRRRINLD
jgi:hypothetical protein